MFMDMFVLCDVCEYIKARLRNCYELLHDATLYYSLVALVYECHCLKYRVVIFYFILLMDCVVLYLSISNNIA